MSQWKKTSCSTAAIYKPKRKKVHMSISSEGPECQMLNYEI